MGAAFISHHHHLARTHVNTKGFPAHADNSSMLAEALAFHMLLLDATATNSKSLHVIADSKTLQKIGVGTNITLGPEHNSPLFASTVADIISILKTFDSVYISHVHSHKNKLSENSFADLIAGISCANTNFTLCETVFSSNHSALLKEISGYPIPRSCSRIDCIPFISADPGGRQCTICKCPSHLAESCVFSLEAHSFPIPSIYAKTRPDRPDAFVDQVCNPAIIDWDKAPSSLGGDLFVRFVAVCLNDLRHPTRYQPALHAMSTFAHTYRLVRGHISRRKRFEGKHSGHHPLDESAKLARDASIAAEHARNMRYSDAMRALNREEPIGPLHPEAAAQLLQLYPERVRDPQIPPSSTPSGRQTFDRSAVWMYVKSRAATSSPGISGFGFNWIQHFGKLTAGHETPDNLDPHWTILLALIEDLACGELPWLRQWATSLKGSMFNKTGDLTNIKVRNLGIAEALVRIASHMVADVAFPLARDKGLIGDFDLGVGIPGGTEKFVKLNQLAAAAGCPILSADVEKAFNTMLRADIWDAVQYLDCPLLTSWFCFFFHTPPKVFFAADPMSAFHVSNTITYTLWEGVAQGDPCSSLLFVITLSHILKDFKLRHPDTILATVIDDTSLIFSNSSAQRLPLITLNFINTLQLHNLKVNTSKTVLFCDKSPLPFDPGPLPFAVSAHSFSACRRIIGSRSAVADDTNKIIADITKAKAFYVKLYTALQTHRVPGRGFIFSDIIRLSFRSRWQWAMRTLTPPAASRVATAADAVLTHLLNLLLPHHPPPTLPPSWMHLKALHQIKLALPLKRGGLGLRSWQSLRHITHFSSWIEASSRATLMMTRLNLPFPPCIIRDIGDSVAVLSRVLKNPPDFWLFGSATRRFKIQHHLTRQLDDFDYSKGSSLSHDPSVNAQFIGSCLPHMCLPFNSASVPLADICSCDEPLFSYALAFHTMMPLFSTHICSCGTQVDPLGLHFALCNKLNARNLLHNALRDCFYGALRRTVRDSPGHNVALLASDKWAKSSTYIHAYYPRRHNAPPILERQPPHTNLPPRVAPSKSPDLLVIYADAPLRPMFADFVFASPRLSDNTTHTQAAQIAFNKKRADYSKHHIYPDNTFFPLAAERSGYLHPTFTDFIATFLSLASSSRPTPAHTLQIMYSVAFAITRMSASLLRAASFNLSPSTIRSLCPPPPLIPPVRWAPGLLLHDPRRLPYGTHPHSSGHQRGQVAVSPTYQSALPHVTSRCTDVVGESALYGVAPHA
jgi:hypothetical protein